MTMERASESRIAVPGGQREGIDMHQGDIRPPFVNVVQSTSQYGEPGNFRRNDTEEEYEQLNVVPVRIQKNRTFWGPGDFSRDRTPRCFSVDGNFGAMSGNDGNPTEYPGQACAMCPELTDTPWLPGHRDRCQPGYMVLLFNVDSLEVLGMRLTGTMARLARVFMGGSVFRKRVMHLTTERVTNDQGTWYNVKTKVGPSIDEAIEEILLAETALHSGARAVSEEGTATPVNNSASAVQADPSRDQAEAEYLANHNAAQARLSEEPAEQGQMALDDNAEDSSFDPDNPPW